MKNRNRLFAACVATVWLAVYACTAPHEKSGIVGNPPAPGFDSVGSDPAAIQLADSIIHAMGGRQAWEDTRFIQWNFFDRRDLTWDKHTGWVRIESPGDSTTYLVNVNTHEGKVKIKGTEFTEGDTLTSLLKRAEAIWINDSYWLVMPFKLKDSGVTLKYLGEDTLANATYYNILQLTFNEVGNTPQNKYKLYVDLKEKLVKYWAFYPSADNDTAAFVRPWDNYQKYGTILLSADRSDNGGPKRVKVPDTLPQDFFVKF
ncbi:MAG: hypothetical protein MUC38_03895 [Cyclobacteriaceae bacterium]|jgi:hypothetical protein|nr:hypothetical protein [Cyclobacteriaceae bacterium]